MPYFHCGMVVPDFERELGPNENVPLFIYCTKLTATFSRHMYVPLIYPPLSTMRLRNTGVTPALHRRYTGVTPALHRRYTVATPALHRRYTGVTPELQRR